MTAAVLTGVAWLDARQPNRDTGEPQEAPGT